MKLIMVLFLNFLGLLPAIAITALAFIINPVLGGCLGLFFLAVAVCSAIHTIHSIRKNRR